jgi:hypothetical protein
MAYFAEIDSNNIVLRVLRVPTEQEGNGQNYLANEIGLGGTWIQTSYNSTIRYHFAGIGYVWNPTIEPDGAFYAQQPYPSWSLNADYEWVAPVPYPEDGKNYVWDEETQSWVEIA